MRGRPASGGWIASVGAIAICAWGGQRMVARVVDGAAAEHTASASSRPASSAAPRWPDGRVALTPIATVFPPGFGVRRITLDPGHGAPGNSGNTSCFCVAEQDFTLAAVDRIAARLEATGHFQVLQTRAGDEKIPYPARVDAAEADGAEAFVSIHSDVRGEIQHWTPADGDAGAATKCPVAEGSLGFSVLYSDEGDDLGLVAARRDLARALADRLKEAGFPEYDGSGYQANYEPDPARGVFVDRHAVGQRIFVLRKPTMPAILLETHNALDPAEAARWTENETCDAAADALAAALIATLGGT